MATPPRVPTLFQFAGILLALGCVVFVVGIALYAVLPSELGTPAAETSYSDARAEATALPSQMERGGRVIYLGDLLIAVGAPEAFPAFKSWFDLQFATGNIPFGVGAVAVFLADPALTSQRSQLSSITWPRWCVVLLC